MKRLTRIPLALALLAFTLLAACPEQAKAPKVNPEMAKHGTVEVTAKLLDVAGDFPENNLYDYVFVMKYAVLSVHRGKLSEKEILVGHYNPRKPRAAAADEHSGPICGDVTQFRPGSVHRMALAVPLDEHYMGGIIDKYFAEKATRHWAICTDRADN